MIASTTWGRVYIGQQERCEDGYRYTVIIQPESPTIQAMGSLSAIQFLLDSFLRKAHTFSKRRVADYLSLVSERLENSNLSEDQKAWEKFKALEQAVVAFVDEEILYKYWEDRRLRDSDQYENSERANYLRDTQPLNDGRTVLTFHIVIDRIGPSSPKLSAAVGLSVRTPEASLFAEDLLRSAGINPDSFISTSEATVGEVSLDFQAFIQSKISDDAIQHVGELRRLYNTRQPQDSLSSLVAMMASQRVFLRHVIEASGKEQEHVLNHLWLVTDRPRAVLYRSKESGYGFQTAVENLETSVGKRFILYGTADTVLNMLRKELDPENYQLFGVNRTLFYDGPYLPLGRSARRKLVPSKLRNVEYLAPLMWEHYRAEFQKPGKCFEKVSEASANR